MSELYKLEWATIGLDIEDDPEFFALIDQSKRQLEGQA